MGAIADAEAGEEEKCKGGCAWGVCLKNEWRSGDSEGKSMDVKKLAYCLFREMHRIVFDRS